MNVLVMTLERFLQVSTIWDPSFKFLRDRQPPHGLGVVFVPVRVVSIHFYDLIDVLNYYTLIA